jgi:ligand-binding SRPBCC domain-containing protein
MSHHSLERCQVVRGDLPSVFRFFEDPANLERITPRWLRFAVVDASDARVRHGTEIEYRLRWQGISLRWRSRISEYRQDSHFADEMLVGPYRRWYHRHLFREVPGGVEMRDIVDYELPLGLVGDFVHAIVVRRQLRAIFDHRAHAIAGIFPTRSSGELAQERT